MSVFIQPSLRLTSCSFVAITALLFSSTSLQARTIIIPEGEEKSIDKNSNVDDYIIRPNATLNVNGAETQQIVANNSKLNINTGTTWQINVTNGSKLAIEGATITANTKVQGSHDGIYLVDSYATIGNSTVSSSDGAGLRAAEGSAAGGSTFVVSDSKITGTVAGASASQHSKLHFSRSHLAGTNSTGSGMRLYSADATAVDSTITGGLNGVSISSAGTDSRTSKVVLDNSQVQGLAGSAILVNGFNLGHTETHIEVLNGTQLKGFNDVLLEVKGAATANMLVGNSALTGNVQVNDNSKANLTFDQGRMTGDVLLEEGSSANVTLKNQSVFTGRLDKVDAVTINSQSNWNMTGNDSVGSLAMNGGTVTFGAQDVPNTFYQLNVGSLAGDGTFAMKGDFTTGERDFLNVAGNASGNFGLLVSASGTDAASPQQLRMVHTGAGDAQFSLVGGPVDVGTWSYDLINKPGESGANDWYLDPTTKTISPGARSVLALFNTAPTVWYGELSSLRSRMGELRFNGGQSSGAWVRTYGNKYDVAAGSGVGYKQTQKGISLGVDTPVGDDGWLVGVLAGHSQSDLDLKRGTSGTVKSFYVGPYATWIDADSGYYFDGVIKFNRFHNDSKVGLSDGTRSKGDYTTTGVGGSAEFGRHIALDNGSFIEPFTQLAAVTIAGKNYDLDNGMQAEGDRANSLLGKVGVTLGHNFDLSGGRVLQPYLRGAMVHEFARNNKVQVNNNVFNNDLSGSRAELGLGVAVSLSKNLQVHADFDYAKGEHIEQPLGVNVGLRLDF